MWPEGVLRPVATNCRSALTEHQHLLGANSKVFARTRLQSCELQLSSCTYQLWLQWVKYYILLGEAFGWIIYRLVRYLATFRCDYHCFSTKRPDLENCM